MILCNMIACYNLGNDALAELTFVLQLASPGKVWQVLETTCMLHLQYTVIPIFTKSTRDCYRREYPRSALQISLR